MYTSMGDRSYCSTSTNNNAPLFTRIGGSFETRNTKNYETQIKLKKILTCFMFYLISSTKSIKKRLSTQVWMVTPTVVPVLTTMHRFLQESEVVLKQEIQKIMKLKSN